MSHGNACGINNNYETNHDSQFHTAIVPNALESKGSKDDANLARHVIGGILQGKSSNEQFYQYL